MSKSLRINGKTIFSSIIVVLLVVVVVTLVVMMNNTKTSYNDDYFKSDSTKIVTEITPDVAFLNSEDEPPEVVKAYMVYYYSGEKITGLKTFYKYNSPDNAKKAYDLTVEAELPWANNKELSNEYVIVDMVESEYNTLSPDIVRSFSE